MVFTVWNEIECIIPRINITAQGVTLSSHFRFDMLVFTKLKDARKSAYQRHCNTTQAQWLDSSNTLKTLTLVFQFAYFDFPTHLRGQRGSAYELAKALLNHPAFCC